MPDSIPTDEHCPIGAGSVLDKRYHVEHLVGEGTFGWVFSALDIQGTPSRRVAIKVLRPRYATQEEGLRRFERRELVLLQRVQEFNSTPHVVRVLESRVLMHDEKYPYLVLEFIDGPSLRDFMEEQHPIDAAVIQRLGAGIARGLAAIHASGGVHRDLKPANIRLRGGVEPVIVDLGINRALWDTHDVTEMGQAPMTPRYASPEQLSRLEAGPASDVYSLGLILYEMMTGDVPRVGENLKERLDSGRDERLVTLHTPRKPRPRHLRAWVLRCLSQNPMRRPRASDVASALSREPEDLRPGRERLWWGLLTGVIALLIVLSKWIGFPLRPSPADPPATPRPWIHSLGISEPMDGLRMAADSKGNVFITGGARKDLDLGNGPLVARGQKDVFLARLDPKGNPVWSKRFGDRAWEEATDIGIDSKGNAWILGTFDGTLDLGCRPMFSTSKDAFLARVDTEGHCLWSRRFGGAGEQISSFIHVYPEGDVLVTGHFSDSMTFDEVRLVGVGAKDIFLARFADDGELRWARGFGSQNSTYVDRMGVDSSGNIHLTGIFTGILNLGGRTLDSGGGLARFVVTLDEEGEHLWSANVESLLSQGQTFVASPGFDKDGHTFLLTQAPVTRSQQYSLMGGAASRVLFLTCLNGDGSLRWTRPIGVFEKYRLGLTTTPEGRLLVVGAVEGNVDSGDAPLSGLGGQDLFLLELLPDGTPLKARRFGNASEQEINSIAFDIHGNLLVAGQFEGTLDLGSGMLTSRDGPTWFIALVARSVPAPEAHSCLSPPEELVAWYPLDMPDLTAPQGAAPQGQLVGEAYPLAGRGFGVLRLDGGYFQVPDADALDFGRGPFSISAWIRTTDAEEIKVIVDKRTEPPNLGPVRGYSLYLKFGRLSFQLADGHGSGRCSSYPNVSCTNYESDFFVADGAWHLVTVTVERGAQKHITIHGDGQPVARFKSVLHTDSVDNEHPLRIGSRSSNESALFRGLIDEVALWKRALSSDEVAGLYQAGSMGMCRSRPPAEER
jgi:serine/threonine-protein kinase